MAVRTGAAGWLRPLANRRVNTKIMISLAVSAAATVGVALVGVSSLARLSGDTRQLYASSMLPMSHLADLHDSELKSRLELHRIAVQTTAAGRRDRLAGLHETDAELASALAAYRQTSTEAGTPALGTFEAKWNAYIALRDQQMLPLAMSGDVADFARIQDDQAQPLISDAADALDALQVQETARAAAQAARAQDTYRRGRLLIIVFLLLGVGLSVLLGQLVARLIVRPLRQVGQVLDGVAEGDLTRSAAVGSTDELGRMASALDRAVGRTRDVVEAVTGGTSRLLDLAGRTETTSAEIAGQAAEAASDTGLVRSTADEVSQDVQTVASSTEEMRASIADIANSSAQAAAVAADAVRAATETNETVARLGVSSAEIDTVVRTITTIAAQTNLLALNATIEAARAGEAGKGFAVVAGEVKDLAQETASATEDITRRVQAIQADTSSAVTAIGRIVEVVGQIAEYQQTIAAAVEEQTATAGEISRSVTSAAAGTTRIASGLATVSDRTTSTSDGVARTRAAAVELTELSTELGELVRQFRV